MNGFLKNAAVFIGGVIVVIDVVSRKDPSLLHSNYRLPDLGNGQRSFRGFGSLSV